MTEGLIAARYSLRVWIRGQDSGSGMSMDFCEMIRAPNVQPGPSKKGRSSYVSGMSEWKMDARLLLAGMTEGPRVSMRAVVAGLRSFAAAQDDNGGNKMPAR
ncbi:MAG: hypothetical protein OEZ41_13995 [Nitrospirota bacterium]|nr:hypothetical protein [Nitrospirota bacterium]